MKWMASSLIFFVFLTSLHAQGKVGVNTTTPAAMLHVKDSSVVFTGLTSLPVFPGNPPVSGYGARMMWYPDKAAFRSGYISNTFPDYWNKENIGLYSIGMGWDTKASGQASIAFGSFTIASGSYSTAMGVETTASGTASTSLGYNTIATGLASTAMGSFNTASGPYSTALGNGTNASGHASTALGGNSVSTGNFSIAIGGNSFSSGWYSTAMGLGARAQGDASTSIGDYTIASGSASTALGRKTISKSYAGTVIGSYNDSTNASNSGSFDPNNRLFQIGNGTTDNARSNAMTVLQNGNIGIGTTMPYNILDIVGRMRLRNGSGGSAGFYMNNNDNSAELGFMGSFGNDNLIGMYGYGGADWGFVMNTTSGNIGIGTTAPAERLNVVGNGLFTGTVTASCGVLVCSDIRYKKNILPITNALTRLQSIHGIYYNWDNEKFTDKNFGDERQIGFSAQELEKVYPEMVKTDENGFKTVDYSRLTPVLVEAIKEQDLKMDEQQIVIQKQQEQINYLLKEMVEMKRHMVTESRSLSGPK